MKKKKLTVSADAAFYIPTFSNSPNPNIFHQICHAMKNLVCCTVMGYMKLVYSNYNYCAYMV